MTSTVEFSNALNGCMPYFLLNKDSYKLMLSDLGVNRDIMHVIGRNLFTWYRNAVVRKNRW